jgi:thioredoxin-related protein
MKGQNARPTANFLNKIFGPLRKCSGMKTKLLVAIICSAVFFSAFRTVGDGELPIGAGIPKANVKMKDVSGKEVTLSDAKKENGLLVMFTCNTCPYVIRNQERTRQICEYAASKGIGVILLNSNEEQRNSDDSFDEMKSYAREQGYHWFYAVDSKNELADAFGASRTPECYLFDKSGKLVYHGAIDDNPADQMRVKRKHLQQAIDEALSGKEITVKTTRSVGCGIKRI